ncbi:hypothetical protein V8C86DRAFT_2912651 [Haematococcus lacustris]
MPSVWLCVLPALIVCILADGSLSSSLNTTGSRREALSCPNSTIQQWLSAHNFQDDECADKVKLFASELTCVADTCLPVDKGRVTVYIQSSCHIPEYLLGLKAYENLKRGYSVLPSLTVST